MEETKKTVGALALELMQKEPEQATAIDYEREIHKDWDQHVIEALKRGCKMFSGDFYLVVETKKERLMQNVLRNYFFPRESCPTPQYDQSVFKYHRKTEMLEFLWVVPSKDTCYLLRDNALTIPPDQKDLLFFVMDFFSGALDVRARKYNGELEA